MHKHFNVIRVKQNLSRVMSSIRLASPSGVGLKEPASSSARGVVAPAAFIVGADRPERDWVKLNRALRDRCSWSWCCFGGPSVSPTWNYSNEPLHCRNTSGWHDDRAHCFVEKPWALDAAPPCFSCDVRFRDVTSAIHTRQKEKHEKKSDSNLSIWKLESIGFETSSNPSVCKEHS
jgi:hypothetical protein